MTVTGWIDRDEVRRHLTSARCLIFPSHWYETYGLVVAEAAAYGIPAIVSDVTAAAERVEDGATGWVFRSGDTADLARCLGEAADDTWLGRMSAAAYDRFWQAAPTSTAHAADLLAIYDAVLETASVA
jgi:glycosyltransferase involved in cell wall biosynthesis